MLLESLRKKDIYWWVLLIIIIVTFFKGLTWIAVVPLWHTPDEAAHFSTIQHYAEQIDLTKVRSGFGASRELQITEQFLETERGDDGTTAFTFKPNYKIQYSQSQAGIYEKEISSLPIEYRKQLVHHEQAYYPPLYYWIGQIIYQSVYKSDIILRAFTIRLFSILTIIGVVIVSYFLAKEIFPQKKYLHLTLPIIVSFQPMLSFVSAGINSDNLFNFLFSLFLLLGVYLITRGLDLKKVMFLGGIVGLGFLVKPQFIIALVIAICLIIYDFVRTKRVLFFISTSIIFLTIMIAFGGFTAIQEAMANFRESGLLLPYIETGSFSNPQSEPSFFSHLQNSFRQTIAQTLPWYWGVFKWLSLTLPRVINQILMRVMLVGAIGLVVKFFLDLKKRDFSRPNQAFIFLAFSAIIYFFAIIWRDWQHLRAFGFSLGIQGRYFFPVLTAHLTLLFVGLLTLTPEKFKKITVALAVIGSILLNFIALYTVIATSYVLNSFTVVINQMSQYKPWYFKGELLIVLFCSYLIATISLLIVFGLVLLRKSQ